MCGSVSSARSVCLVGYLKGMQAMLELHSRVTAAGRELLLPHRNQNASSEVARYCFVCSRFLSLQSCCLIPVRLYFIPLQNLLQPLQRQGVGFLLFHLPFDDGTLGVG